MTRLRRARRGQCPLRIELRPANAGMNRLRSAIAYGGAASAEWPEFRPFPTNRTPRSLPPSPAGSTAASLPAPRVILAAVLLLILSSVPPTCASSRIFSTKPTSRSEKRRHSASVRSFVAACPLARAKAPPKLRKNSATLRISARAAAEVAGRDAMGKGGRQRPGFCPRRARSRGRASMPSRKMKGGSSARAKGRGIKKENRSVTRNRPLHVKYPENSRLEVSTTDPPRRECLRRPGFAPRTGGFFPSPAVERSEIDPRSAPGPFTTSSQKIWLDDGQDSSNIPVKGETYAKRTEPSLRPVNPQTRSRPPAETGQRGHDSKG